MSATEKLENTLLESNTPSNLYKPLEQGSKKIRVLSIQPLSDDESSDEPVSCSMEEVDLSDWTPTYQSFRDSLSLSENEFRLIEGRIRHVLWDLHNYTIRHGLHLRENFSPLSPMDVKENLSLHAYCDKPLEQFTALDDRYNWGDFVALSYVWGDQTHKKTISLNGSRFEVGSNLHEALLSLRNSLEVKSRALKVWIDAICINQDDLQERATEVQKMELIYSEALVVRAWLGNPSPEVSTEY
ncbi:hypothetical protein INS49_004080 [Diaporthe citri]|uniref:uncharacterized protein n=1 Tax=Diaporthe citri TaxID=83186 RepID=UPI001C823C33|nr:uncharacterized protein INS49_004080 [Diaporthe citri]KAG6354999.1 hypothetical protein INS49_004080 [Diaporthe citri]